MGQVLNTSLVALLSGLVATTLFLLARHQAHTSSELAAVDATQSSEVIFALLGEMLFLGTALPNAQAWLKRFFSTKLMDSVARKSSD